MNSNLTLSALGRRVRIEANEAVAIAQQVVEVCTRQTTCHPPFGPPSVDTVFVEANGEVLCPGCAATPAVSEIALLLDALLPRGNSVRVPGALRYALARALLEVDVPPFDTLSEFTTVLSRFERGDRRAVVRALMARADAPIALVAKPPPIETEPAVEPIVVVVPARSHRLTPLVGALAVVIVALAAFLLGQRWPAPSVRSDTESTSINTKPPEPISLTGSQPTVVAPAAASTPAKPHARPERLPKRSRPVARALGQDAEQELSPAFASNGTAMFFHTGLRSSEPSALKSTNPLSDDLRVVTIVDDGSKNYHAQPSPDGTRIAFDSDREGERGVYIANIDGSNVKRTSGAGYAAVPTWSPDGTRLAFIRAEASRPRVWNLWLQTLDTGATRRLTSFRYGQTWGASWFPDGRRVCFTHEDRVIVMDLESGATKEYATPVKGHLVRTPAVSPDGTRVIFQVHRNGAWLLDLKSGGMLCVLTDPTAEEFAWTPDGRRVAFHSRRDGQWGIWITAPDRIDSL